LTPNKQLCNYIMARSLVYYINMMSLICPEVDKMFDSNINPVTFTKPVFVLTL